MSKESEENEKVLTKAIKQRAIQVDDDLHSDLSMTIEESIASIFGLYQPNSFKRLFWEHHCHALEVTVARSMRWELAMIRVVFLF